MSTSITVEFQVNDLNANYEVLGTSDNYSFQEKLGLGSNLVLNEGEEFIKAIPLKGHYGVFDIRVFAVTDIGVRSPSLIGSVEVLPKELENTFTFSDITLNNNRYENLESSVTYAPQSPGDKLEVDCEFADKNINFSWSLIPPDGHPLEGTAASNQLLNDSFFSGFKINIKNNGRHIDLDSAGFSSASLDSLSNTFETDRENVSEILQNYRDFYLNLDSNAFGDLELSRNVEVEIVSVDRFGREATGIIRATNPEPIVSNLTHSVRGSEASFSWSSSDVDFDSVDINVLAVPEGTELPFNTDLEASARYFQQLKQAKQYNKYAGAAYQEGEQAVYGGKVYACVESHIRIANEVPDSSDRWELIGDVVDFNYFSSVDDLNKNLTEDATLSSSDDYNNTFSVSQLWGYEYYYTFQPYDGFGLGKVYNFTNNGLVDQDDPDSVLDPLITNIKIDNLRFREVKDDLVFNWDIVDQDGNLVDINQYKFLFGGADSPSLLGLSGSLYDVHTQQTITGITEGYNSKSLDFDENGDLIVNANLPSTKVFDQYKYTRELNNSIYGIGGFPSDYQNYNDQATYNLGDHTLSNYNIYTSNTNNNTIAPVYSVWKESETYSAATSDKFVYKNNVYVTTTDFGADASATNGLFDETQTYDIGDIVLSPDQNVSIFSEQATYNPGDFVFYDGAIYECLNDIAVEEIVLPENTEYWIRLDIFEDIKCSYFRSTINNNSSYPFSSTSNWEKLNPENLAANGEFFDVFAPAYEFAISDWSAQAQYSAGSFVVYANDVWSGVQSSQGQTPSVGSSFWANTSNGQDLGANYQAGDLVYSNNFIYQCTQNNPAGGPIVARTNEGDTILSSYQDTNWLPFWELNDQYSDIVFGHVGIPQSGKRAVGIELGIVDKKGNIVNKANLNADNPAPYILTEGFKVDSTSEATKVKFSFNYALGFQEKTTKVHLYRSTGDVFDITGADGLPYEKVVSQIGGSVDVSSGSNEVSGINTLFLSELSNDSVIKIEDQIFSVDTIIDDENLTLSSNSSKDVVGGSLYKNADSTLVSITLGAEDAAFGENINQIIDEPPIPSINGVDQITGYYYKILPFDDFGSGVLYNVPDGSVDQVIVYPKRYNNPNPNVMPGRVLRADPTVAAGAVPGKISNFSGSAAFENYFLNWNAPNTDYEPGSTKLLNWTENDIDHYEVWASEDKYLRSGVTETQAINWIESQNTGYRKIQGVAYNVGEIPKEDPDPARYIYGAENIFNVPANSPSSEVVYPGETNDTRSFWIRAVDFAGNKSPFVGGTQPGINDPISGLTLTLGQVQATNISGFESSITNKFYNTIALNPNNPFDDIQNGWNNHELYHTGQKYNISPSSEGLTNGYIWWQTGNNYYNTGAVHPATTKEADPSFTDFNDGDFIIARVTDGNATPVFHAFANALIGTANIAEAAIINAQINDLSADKITAGQIKGHRIEITHSGGNNTDQYGSIASVGFDGINYIQPETGFVLSGDGTFAFQHGEGALTFEDEKLILYGGLRSSRALDFDFVDIDLSPQFFTYHERQDGTFEPADDCPTGIDIRTTFRNSRVEPSGVRFKMEAVSGSQRHDVFGYDDHDSNGNYNNISGFTYLTGNFNQDTERKTASATFDLTGFSGILEYYDQIADSVVITAKSNKSELERSTTITRVIDGRVGDDGNSPSVYYIKPTSGTALKNSSGSLEVEARQIIDGVDSKISSGNIKLYVGTSDKGYDETFNASQINGSVLVELKEGSTVYDTITLIDVTDGEDAIVGSVTSNQSLAYIQDKNDGSWSSTSNSTLTAEFYKNGSLLNTKTATVVLNSTTGTLSSTGGTNITVSGNNTSAITITFTYNSVSVSETVYAARGGDKGDNGNNGLSPTYRGQWDKDTLYINIPSTSTDPGRGDIVYYDGYMSGTTQYYGDPNTKYYICIKDIPNISSQDFPPYISTQQGVGTLNSTYWLEFGDEFDNVATNILLTEEAYITDKLIIGDYGFSGAIVSNGFTGGLLNVNTEPYQELTSTTENYDTPGFLLARTDDGVVFDVGGTGIIGQTGYIRLDSKSGKLEIAGSFINNTVIDENIIYTGVFELGQTDELTSFIGGGYNNDFIQNSTEEFQNIGSSIVGGAWNEIQGRFSTIAGGYSGLCRDNFSFIGGGWHNQMTLLEPGNHQGANFIGCGIYNTISGGAGQIILNGGNNLLSGPTGSYEPVLDFDNDLYSKYILGTGDSSLTLTEGGWTTESWIGAFYSQGAGALRGLSSKGWIYSLNFDWSFIPSVHAFAYIDEPINGIWIYFSEFHNNKHGWYWLLRPEEENMYKFDIYNPNTEGLYAYYNSDSNWVFFDRTSDNKLRGYYYSSNSWVNLT